MKCERDHITRSDDVSEVDCTGKRGIWTLYVNSRLMSHQKKAVSSLTEAFVRTSQNEQRSKFMSQSTSIHYLF